MEQKVAQVLKEDLCDILRDYSEKGITSRNELEGVKIALSALQKLLTIEAMERVGGYSSGRYCDDNSNDKGNSYRRDSRGRYFDDSPRENGYSAHDDMRNQIQKMMQYADTHDREILEKMLRQL